MISSLNDYDFFIPVPIHFNGEIYKYLFYNKVFIDNKWYYDDKGYLKKIIKDNNLSFRTTSILNIFVNNKEFKTVEIPYRLFSELKSFKTGEQIYYHGDGFYVFEKELIKPSNEFIKNWLDNEQKENIEKLHEKLVEKHVEFFIEKFGIKLVSKSMKKEVRNIKIDKIINE